MKCKTTTTQSEMLATSLRDQIVDGAFEPGSRMPTFQEIESNFQVSRGVVQQAIARLKQDGFVNTQSRRGGLFVVDHPPHLKRYAIVTPTSRGADCWSIFNETILRESHLYAQENEGCEFVQFLGTESIKDGVAICRQLKQEIEQHRLAGLILLPGTFEMVHELSDIKVPKVYLNSHYSQNYHPSVVDDIGCFLNRSLRWFADHGRKRVAVVHMSDTHDELTHEHYENNGLMYYPQWRQMIGRNAPHVVSNLIPLLMDYEPDKRPDGLLIADDNLVEYAVSALLAMGLRIGHDIDIVAHCNWPCPTPKMIPMQRIGFHAGHMLQKAIEQIDLQRANQPIVPFQTIPPLFDDEV